MRGLLWRGIEAAVVIAQDKPQFARVGKFRLARSDPLQPGLDPGSRCLETIAGITASCIRAAKATVPDTTA